MRRTVSVLVIGLTILATAAAGQRLRPDFLVPGVLEGRSHDAIAAARRAADDERGLAALAAVLVTFGRWDDVLREPLPPPSMRYATAMTYYARGIAFAVLRRWPEARAARDSVAVAAATLAGTDEGRSLRIATRAVRGEIALRRGQAARAVSEFQAAVRMEEESGGSWYYPTRHSLGKALLAAGRPHEAAAVYREDLVRHPENGWALYGLAQCLLRTHQDDEARSVRRRFEHAWAGSDVYLTASRF